MAPRGQPPRRPAGCGVAHLHHRRILPGDRIHAHDGGARAGCDRDQHRCGTTWTAANVPANTGLLQSVFCATVTSCVAGGTTSTTVSAVVPGPRGNPDQPGRWANLDECGGQALDRRRLRRLRAPRRSCAPWWAPNGWAPRPSAWVGSHRVATAAASFIALDDRIHAPASHGAGLSHHEGMHRRGRKHTGEDCAHQEQDQDRSVLHLDHTGGDCTGRGFAAGAECPTRRGQPRCGSTLSPRSRMWSRSSRSSTWR